MQILFYIKWVIPSQLGTLLDYAFTNLDQILRERPSIDWTILNVLLRPFFDNFQKKTFFSMAFEFCPIHSLSSSTAWY